MSRFLATAAVVLLLASPLRAAQWTPIDSGVATTFVDLSFHDASHGVAVGEGGIVLLTDDGGETWGAPAGSLPSAVDLHGVSFGDALHGVTVGKDGTVWWTADGGQHWTEGASGTPEDLFDVAMFGPSEGMAVGRVGTVLRTVDGGATWTPLPSGTTEPLWGLSPVNATTVVVVGDYTILRTADGGASWDEIDHPMTISWLYDVDFADDLHGHAVGDFATILRTEDGGLSWTLEHSSDDDAEFLLTVAHKDATHAIAVGWIDRREHNAIWSSDGGLNWTPEPTGYDRSLRAVTYREDLLIATGLGGLFFKAQMDPTSAPTSVRTAALLQNRPNPFNPGTRIPFVLDRTGEVSLVVYDMAGRAVRTLVHETRAAGHHEVIWSGRDESGQRVASGVYAVELTTGSTVETRRMTLVK